MTPLSAFILGVVLALSLFLLRRRFAEFPGQQVADYVDDFPVLDLRQYFGKPLVCEGVIFGPMGRITSRFVAYFTPEWNGDTCVLREVFHYHDGSTQAREWTLTFGKSGNFTATAPDVRGQGVGQVAGPTVMFNYKIELPPASGGHVLRTIDWMYLTPDGTIMNRSQFRKFGFRVAELIATIRPGEPS